MEKEGLGLNLTYEVKDGILNHTGGTAETLEGQVVKAADKIAYINHDIEDAIRGNIIKETDLPWNCLYILGRNKSARITTLVNSLIENSYDHIKMSDEVKKAHDELRAFMFENVYIKSLAKTEEAKAEGIVESLFNYFVKNIDILPNFYKSIAEKESKQQAVSDYIAGMTDSYAVEVFSNVFIPKSWQL